LEDDVDYVKVAEGLGCEAYRVTEKEELMPVLKKALKAKGPVVLDCVIREDDKVFPMVPGGQPLEAVFDDADMKNRKQ
ncbi:MAG: acetolactate synthase large subunit, partial [Lachnospiraceae bacterium]|nr:acetolactate synthase large subunit [Lachnospiraceae bacterium]